MSPRRGTGDARRSPAETASCSALAARLQREAGTLAGVLERLRSADADPAVVRELADVLEDLDRLATALHRHVDSQVQARGMVVQRAASVEGRGRHALLRTARGVRRASGQYGGLP